MVYRAVRFRPYFLTIKTIIMNKEMEAIIYCILWLGVMGTLAYLCMSLDKRMQKRTFRKNVAKSQSPQIICDNEYVYWTTK